MLFGFLSTKNLKLFDQFMETWVQHITPDYYVNELQRLIYNYKQFKQDRTSFQNEHGSDLSSYGNVGPTHIAGL